MTEHARTYSFPQGPDGYSVKVGGPNVADLSAPIDDPMTFVVVAANAMGLEVDDSVDGQITVSVPPGA